MQLEDFVTSTLKQVLHAVESVSKEEQKGSIRLLSGHEKDGGVAFDLAVSAESGGEKAGKAGIKVLEVIQGGVEKSSINKHSSVSRVKFRVTI